MGKKHYDWDQGRAEIEEHSLTKHSVLVEYLLAYFSQRMVNRRGAERFRITLGRWILRRRHLPFAWHRN